MKKIFFYQLLMASLIAFFGCTKDKKNSGSAVAVTPLPPAANACSNYQQLNGFYYDNNHNVVACNIAGGDANSCTKYRFDASRGFYVDTAGNRVECNFNSVFNNNGILPYNTGNGCTAYTQGTFYPVLMGAELACVHSLSLMANFTPSYINSIYSQQMWMPGNPLLASCQMGTTNCRCNGMLWGTLQWCWAQF